MTEPTHTQRLAIVRLYAGMQQLVRKLHLVDKQQERLSLDAPTTTRLLEALRREATALASLAETLLTPAPLEGTDE